VIVPDLKSKSFLRSPVDELKVRVPVPSSRIFAVPVTLALLVIVSPDWHVKVCAGFAALIVVVVLVDPRVTNPAETKASSKEVVIVPLIVIAFGHVLPLLVKLPVPFIRIAPDPEIVIAAASVTEPLTVICCDIVIVLV